MAPLTRARQLQIRRLTQEHNAYIDYAIAARMHDAPLQTPEQDRLNAYLIQRIEDRAARIWVKLPQAERDRFERVWNIVQDARVAAREARRIADNAHELWTARLRDQPNTIPWGDVHDDMEGVAQEFHNVVITQQLCIDAHNLFIPIVDDICGEITIEYARRGLRTAQRRLARALDAEALWRERADPEHPPIPLRNGKRKLPEHDMPAENNVHRRVRRWRQLRDRQDGYLDDSWEGAWS